MWWRNSETTIYRMWRIRMELILERANLKGFVNGFETIMSSEPELRDCESRDLYVRPETIMHLSD